MTDCFIFRRADDAPSVEWLLSGDCTNAAVSVVAEDEPSRPGSPNYKCWFAKADGAAASL